MTIRERRICTEDAPPPQGVKVIATPNKLPAAAEIDGVGGYRPTAFRYVTSYLEVFDDEVAAIKALSVERRSLWANARVKENEDRISNAVGGDGVVQSVDETHPHRPWIGR